MFEPTDRQYIRNQLASTLRGTIAQKLVNNKFGGGRRPACENSCFNTDDKDFIIKDELEQVYTMVKKVFQ